MASSGPAVAQSAQAETVTVTVDNFTRAESDDNLARTVARGRFGKLGHDREFPRVDEQPVVRLNRDTLYSTGVFDLDAGPVTISLPAAGGRFMSLMFVNQDHYVPVATIYEAGSYTFTREQAGTRYVMFWIRTFVDPNDPEDLRIAHELQDSIRVAQDSPGIFEVPNWDKASLARVRDAIKSLVVGMAPTRVFGKRGDVDPIHHLIGTAAGWAGNPAADAQYTTTTPKENDGQRLYRLRVKDVPVDAFWSITVYDQDGFWTDNPLNKYSLNNITAEQSPDGSYEIQFGGCDLGSRNCLPIAKGWTYTVRMYRPRAEIRDGSWKFPEAELVA